MKTKIHNSFCKYCNAPCRDEYFFFLNSLPYKECSGMIYIHDTKYDSWLMVLGIGGQWKLRNWFSKITEVRQADPYRMGEKYRLFAKNSIHLIFSSSWKEINED